MTTSTNLLSVSSFSLLRSQLGPIVFRFRDAAVRARRLRSTHLAS